MKQRLKWGVMCCGLCFSIPLYAQNPPRPPANSGYKPMYTPSHPSQGPSLNGGYGGRPAMPRPPMYPPAGHYPPPPRPGVNISYQAPSYSNYNHQTYTWINGEPNAAQIQSSRYVMITDWQRLGLPAPPTGMYWVFEDGRYALVPNK